MKKEYKKDVILNLTKKEKMNICINFKATKAMHDSRNKVAKKVKNAENQAYNGFMKK